MGSSVRTAKGREGHGAIWAKGRLSKLCVFVCVEVRRSHGRQTDRGNVKTRRGIPPLAETKHTLLTWERDGEMPYVHKKVSVYSHVGADPWDWTTGCFCGLMFEIYAVDGRD